MARCPLGGESGHPCLNSKLNTTEALCRLAKWMLKESCAFHSRTGIIINQETAEDGQVTLWSPPSLLPWPRFDSLVLWTCHQLAAEEDQRDCFFQCSFPAPHEFPWISCYHHGILGKDLSICWAGHCTTQNDALRINFLLSDTSTCYHSCQSRWKIGLLLSHSIPTAHSLLHESRELM